MSTKDALIQPIYNCRHREYVELVDSNGAPIALNTGDTELIKDGAAATDATNEMAEITTGYCSIDLTYAEMAYQSLIIIPKSTGALTRIIKLFPQRLPVLRSGTAQAGAAGSITLDASASAKDGAYVGCWVRASNNTPAGIQGQLRKISGYTGSTKVATVFPDWDNNPTSSTTFEVLVPSDMSMSTLLATKAEIVNEWETQSQADPTGFHVNIKEVNGTAQTAGDLAAALTTIDNFVDDLESRLTAARAGYLDELAAANLPSDVDDILADTGVIGVAGAGLTAVQLAAAGVDSIWDEAMHGTKTARQLLGVLLPAFAAAKVTGAGTATITFRDTEDGFNAIVMTVDASGNRSAVTINFA